jgi:hypothetical protein
LGIEQDEHWRAGVRISGQIMSKVFFIKDYLSNRDAVKHAVPIEIEQLSLFPEPKSQRDNYFYYVIDIKKETDESLKEFLSKTHPAAVCEVRDVPTFYTGNLNRSRFFEILKCLDVRYVYPTGLGNPNLSGVCYLVDDESVDSEWLTKRVIELQNG